MTNATVFAAENVSEENEQIDFKTARKLYDGGNYELAVEQLTQLLNAGRGNRASVLKTLASAYYELGAYRDSQKCWEHVLQLDEKPVFEWGMHNAARTNLGNCFLRQGDYEAAEREYRRRLNTTSDGAEHYNLGNLRCLQGQYDEALDWLEQALKLRPDLKSQAREDEDFRPLRPYVRFAEMVTEEPYEFSPVVEMIINVAIIAPLWMTIAPLWITLNVIIRFSTLLLAPFNIGSILYGWFYRRLIRWRNKKVELHGIRFGKTLTCFEKVDATVYDQIDQALELIRRCDPRRYQRICADLDWILIGEISTQGEFHDASQACVLDLDLFGSSDDTDEYRLSSLHKLAHTIVHEACHARLSVMGVHSYKRHAHRHEILCRKQEQRFLEEAKSDERCPVTASFDTQYWCRYGLFEKWYYEGNRWPIYDEYLQHVWSDVDNYVEHVNDLRTSLNENSQGAMAWFVNGYRCGMVRQHADALRDLTTATRLQPSLTNAWRWFGRTAYSHGDSGLAYKSFQSALASEPNDQDILYWLTALAVRSEDDTVAALAYAERLVAEHPHNHASFLYLAGAQFANDQLDAALESVTKTLEYHPECNRGRLLAMRICQSMERDEAATEHWHRYLHDRRDERDKFAKPTKVTGIVVGCDEGRSEHAKFNLRCLFSTRRAGGDQSFLHTLAQQLCAATEKPPVSIAEDYLYSIVRRDSIDGTLFALPKSVAGRSKCYLADIRIPRQCFVDRPSPSEFEVLPIWIDRANLASIFADKAIAGT